MYISWKINWFFNGELLLKFVFLYLHFLCSYLKISKCMRENILFLLYTFSVFYTKHTYIKQHTLFSTTICSITFNGTCAQLAKKGQPVYRRIKLTYLGLTSQNSMKLSQGIVSFGICFFAYCSS